MTSSSPTYQQSPATIWVPTDDQIRNTHISALQRQLRLDSYPALHRWSVEHREQFWDLMIQRLGIRLHRPYSQILELSKGIEQPQWLADARLNIAESCFLAPTDATAIVFQHPSKPLERWSYQMLATLTNRVANGLVAMGFQKGDAIAIALPMTAESVAIYLGIIKAGGVVVSIADSFAPAEINLRLQIAQAQAIFTQDVIWRRGKALPLYTNIIAAQSPSAIVLSHHMVNDHEDKHGLKRQPLRVDDVMWEDFLSDDDQFQAISCDPSDATNILFSSGTTGEPKAIPWDHTTPIKCATDGHLHHDIHADDVVAWPTNLGWMMGPWLIYASLINQATIALYTDAPTDRDFGEFIQQAQVTVLGVVPSLVRTWVQSQCMQGLDWSAIKAFSSTGECSNPEDMASLMSLAGHKPIIEYCGGTEIGGGYITGTLVQPAMPATFTTPALGLDIVILDERGHPSSQGEAFIVPPSIGLSTTLLNRDHHHVYFADTPTFTRPLRRHGDQIEYFFKDSNRYYRALGRVDDTMNLSGIKVSSAEIERVVQSMGCLKEVAAIAVSPSDGGPSQLVLYVVMNPAAQFKQDNLLSELTNHIRQQLNPLFKVYDLVIVDTLPRTASNKVMHRELRKDYYIKTRKTKMH